ncbi:hypothetical protein HBB16_01020 [Pseudonocardia sp. MCCB 268]|nr:hypothetical protein [Pseudonocardia cytotoxica]
MTSRRRPARRRLGRPVRARQARRAGRAPDADRLRTCSPGWCLAACAPKFEALQGLAPASRTTGRPGQSGCPGSEHWAAPGRRRGDPAHLDFWTAALQPLLLQAPGREGRRAAAAPFPDRRRGAADLTRSRGRPPPAPGPTGRRDRPPLLGARPARSRGRSTGCPHDRLAGPGRRGGWSVAGLRHDVLFLQR